MSVIAKAFVLFNLILCLSACPRVAQVDLFNNTDQVLEVIQAGESIFVEPKNISEIRFTSCCIKIKSNLGVWAYDRQLIPYGGENGEYFNGTLYAQIDSNGWIFAVKKGDKRPILNLEVQPNGFPVKPST